MSFAVMDRRRALAFAKALEQEESGSAADRGETRGHGPEKERGAAVAGTGGDPKVARALATAAALREEGAAAPGPSADFRAALRERLLDEASALSTADTSAPSTATVPAPRGVSRRRETPAPRTRAVRWRRRCAVAGVALAMAAGSVGGIAVASSDALPGDMTYGVKRAVEDLQVSMAGSDRERGERYLDQARTRLAEAERLLDREGDGAIGKSTIGHLRSVLSDMREETRKGRELLTASYESSDGGKIGPMRDLAAFARSGSEHMGRIDQRLPGEVSGERDLVWDLLYDIRRQVTPIPGAVAPEDVTAFEEFDKTSAPAGGAAADGSSTTTSDRPGNLAPGAAPQTAPGAPGTSGGPGAPAPLVPAAPTATGQASGSSAPTTGTIGNSLPQVTVPLLEPTPAESASPTQSPGSLGVDVPLPVLPPVGLNVPPLVPGLPGISITIGGAPSTTPPATAVP